MLGGVRAFPPCLVRPVLVHEPVADQRPRVAVAPRERVLQQHDDQVVRVAADAVRALGDELEVGADLVGAGLVGDVAVGEPSRPDHRLAVVAAEQDRRSARSRRWRRHLDAVVPERLTLEREPPAGPRSSQDLDRLLGAGAALGSRRAEHPELLLAPAVADPQDQPAARELVDHGGVLGQPERVVQRREHHPGPELDPFGRGGERRQHRRAARGGSRPTNRGARSPTPSRTRRVRPGARARASPGTPARRCAPSSPGAAR